MLLKKLLELTLLCFFLQATTQCTEIQWIVNKGIVTDNFPVAIKTKSNQQTLNISSTFEKPQVIQIPPSNIDDKYHIIWLKSGNTSQEQSISLNLVSNNQTICEITKKINFETPIDMSKLSSISLLFSITSSQGHSQLFVDCTGNIEVNVGECRLKLDVFYQGEKYCDYIKNSAIGNWNNFKLNLPSNMNQFQSWKMVTKSTGPCKDLSGYMFVGKIIDDKGTEHNFDLIHSVDSKTCEKTNSISQQYSSISGMMFQYGNSFCSSIGLEDCEFSDPTRSNEIFITKKCPKSYNSILIGFSIFGVFALTSLLIFIIVVGFILIRDKYKKKQKKELITHTLVDFDDESIDFEM